MLTAFISMISGLLSGAFPEILKEVRESRAAKREREFLEAQHRWQLEAAKSQADDKLREAEHANFVAELQATRDQLLALFELQGRPSGYKWIDGFNALLRPAAVVGILILFFWVSASYADGVIGQFGTGKINITQLNAAVWGSLLGESFLSVLGFLFGYRSARKV